MSITAALSITSPFTAKWEGFSPNPYWDKNGYAIGYGNHYYSDGSPVEATDDPISKADGLYLLNFTLGQIAPAVSSLLQVPVSDSMLAALTDLTYNWGIGNFQQSKLLALINQEAPQEQLQAQWERTATTSGGVTNTDLIARRAAEAQLAFSGMDSQEAGLGIMIGIILLIVYLSNRRHF